MSALNSFAGKLAPILRQKTTVDGHEIEHVYFVSGGFGYGTEDDGADEGAAAKEPAVGGGGVVLPLGAYYVEDGELRFHANPVVVMWAAVPLAGMATCVLRAFFRAVGKKEKRRGCCKTRKAQATGIKAAK